MIGLGLKDFGPRFFSDRENMMLWNLWRNGWKKRFIIVNPVAA